MDTGNRSLEIWKKTDFGPFLSPKTAREAEKTAKTVKTLKTAKTAKTLKTLKMMKMTKMRKMAKMAKMTTNDDFFVLRANRKRAISNP